MALTKQVPLDGKVLEVTPATKIAALKDRVNKVNTSVSESKVRLEFLKKQYDELKAKALELGVEDTKELPTIISQTEAELAELLSQVESALIQAEQILNA